MKEISNMKGIISRRARCQGKERYELGRIAALDGTGMGRDKTSYWLPLHERLHFRTFKLFKSGAHGFTAIFALLMRGKPSRRVRDIVAGYLLLASNILGVDSDYGCTYISASWIFSIVRIDDFAMLSAVRFAYELYFSFDSTVTL